MASLYRKGSGWAIQFGDRKRRRRTIPLPLMPKRSAEHVKRHAENLIGTYLAAAPLDPETARWLGEVGDQIREKLVEVGLVPGMDAKPATLKYICEQSRTLRHGNKPAVRHRLEMTQRLLLERFGDIPVGAITPADALDFRTWQLGRGLSEATVRKRCSDARSYFAWAIRAKLIEANPFEDVPTTTTAQPNPEYVTEAVAKAVLAELPDSRWRLLFALGRWGGLRMPSEAAAMEWTDINWDRGRFRVKSPKGSKVGKGERWVPLFPELAEAFREHYEASPEGEPRLFPGMSGTATGGLMRNVPLRAITRAGVPGWENLWRTLRASRQTDLMVSFPIHVVCGWLGNTPRVATEHYLRTTEDHWQKAVVHSAATEPEGQLRQTLHRVAPSRRS